MKRPKKSHKRPGKKPSGHHGSRQDSQQRAELHFFGQDDTWIAPVHPCSGNCSKCCMGVGRPPFMPLYREEGGRINEKGWPIDWPFPPGTPQELRDEFLAYMEGVMNRTVEDRAAQSKPCFWLDLETGRCKHYEFRPNICRQHSCDDFLNEADDEPHDDAEADAAD